MRSHAQHPIGYLSTCTPPGFVGPDVLAATRARRASAFVRQEADICVHVGFAAWRGSTSSYISTAAGQRLRGECLGPAAA